MENLDYFITIANSGNGLIAQSKGKIVDAKTGKVLPKKILEEMKKLDEENGNVLDTINKKN
ncbi:MAG: hypothetical protein U9Q72_03095 [Patescibacteria group bacterium]|nr:hypothetical protein [Patescibacteria group bacterium]